MVIDVITPEDYHRLEETTIMSMLSTVSFLQCQIYFMFVKNIYDFSATPLVTETLQSQTATASFQTVRTQGAAALSGITTLLASL